LADGEEGVKAEGVGLVLRGLVEPKRALEYFDSLLLALPKVKADKETIAKVVERLELILKVLKKKVEGEEARET